MFRHQCISDYSISRAKRTDRSMSCSSISPSSVSCFSRSVYAEQFVLKGAQMLQAWDAPLARPTMDIDMLGRVSNTVENLEQIVRACATVEVDADGVEFDPQSVRGTVIVKGKAYE